MANGAQLVFTPIIQVNNATFDVSAITGGFGLAPFQSLFLNKGTVTGTLNANGATIGMTNTTFAAPVNGVVGAFSVTNSTLHFTVTNDFSSSSISVTNLALSTTNSLTATLPAGFQSYPIQLPVIHYANLTLESTFNMGVINLAAGFSGYASNNVANNSIDLVITNGPLGAAVVWSGTASPNINWSDGGSGGNWNGFVAPTPNDSATFSDLGTASQGVVNNVVDQNFTVLHQP